MKEEIIAIRVNAELKKSFKKICDIESTTMSNKLNEFIVNKVKENNEKGGCIIYYIERKKIKDDYVNNEIKTELKTKIIPSNLKDKFMAKFEKKIVNQTINSEEIDSFIS